MKRKILVADDSRMMLRIISSVIEMLDHEPVKASNGQEALDLLEQHQDEIALVLLDWNMPELNGLEALQRIKGDKRWSHLPVMMVTTESEKKNIIMAIQSGASHYLTKPFSQQDLATRILESLGQGL